MCITQKTIAPLTTSAFPSDDESWHGYSSGFCVAIPLRLREIPKPREYSNKMLPLVYRKYLGSDHGSMRHIFHYITTTDDQSYKQHKSLYMHSTWSPRDDRHLNRNRSSVKVSTPEPVISKCHGSDFQIGPLHLNLPNVHSDDHFVPVII